MTKRRQGGGEEVSEGAPEPRRIDWGDNKLIGWSSILLTLGALVLAAIPIWQTYSQNRMGLTVEVVASAPLVSADLPGRG